MQLPFEAKICIKFYFLAKKIKNNLESLALTGGSKAMAYMLAGIGALTAGAFFYSAPCKKKTETKASCIFCKQSESNPRSVVEKQKICEGRHIRLLLDNSPIMPGHVLITTTEHKERSHELDEKEVLAEHAMMQQIAKVYREEYNADSYLVVQKNGRNAGQAVLHYHKHIYPVASKADLKTAQCNFTKKFLSCSLLGAKLKDSELTRIKDDLGVKIAVPEIAADIDIAIDRNLVRIFIPKKQIGLGHVIIETAASNGKAHEITQEEAIACQDALVRIVTIYRDMFDTESYMQLQENGANTGQSTPKFRIHLYAAPNSSSRYLSQARNLLHYLFPCLGNRASQDFKNRIARLNQEALV